MACVAKIDEGWASDTVLTDEWDRIDESTLSRAAVELERGAGVRSVNPNCTCTLPTREWT